MPAHGRYSLVDDLSDNQLDFKTQTRWTNELQKNNSGPPCSIRKVVEYIRKSHQPKSAFTVHIR